MALGVALPRQKSGLIHFGNVGTIRPLSVEPLPPDLGFHNP